MPCWPASKTARSSNLTAYTEVLQDGMLDLIRSGKMALASATALSLSPDAATASSTATSTSFTNRIMLRPQEITNHPEVIRRLGVIAMNGLIEADIYGNVNSTHIMGTSIMNGIGGSGDFARNAYPVDLHDAVDRQGRRDLLHRADGHPRRPHRARRAGDRHRAGPRRPARPVAEAARQR